MVLKKDVNTKDSQPDKPYIFSYKMQNTRFISAATDISTVQLKLMCVDFKNHSFLRGHLRLSVFLNDFDNNIQESYTNIF